MQLTLIFIGINIIVFVLQQFGLFSSMSFNPSLFIHQPWTIVTSMFMHGSAQHLLFNMLGLFMFGSVVEKEFGKLKWLVLYFFAGLSGSLAYMLFGNSIFIPALGASGAIFGLIGGAAILKPKMIIWTAYGPFPMFIAAIGWGIAEFVGMFGVDTIARSAHIGGLVSGAVIAVILLTKINPKFLVPAIFLPFILALFIGASLPSEIPQYTEVPEGFTLDYTQHSAGIKIDSYEKGSNEIVVITSPAREKFNLAVYSRYLEETVFPVYPVVFESECNETMDYKVDVNNETAIIDGSLCSQKFKAIAAVCPKNIDVRIVEFYENQSAIDNFVSCRGLLR